MEAAKHEFTELIDRYLALWNETETARRQDLLALTFTEDATYIDPLMHGEGRTGIDNIIQSAQAQFPGYQLHRTSAVDAYNARVRFAWELRPADGPGLRGGVDFGVVVGDRLQAITGFLDYGPPTGP